MKIQHSITKHKAKKANEKNFILFCFVKRWITNDTLHRQFERLLYFSFLVFLSNKNSIDGFSYHYH